MTALAKFHIDIPSVWTVQGLNQSVLYGYLLCYQSSTTLPNWFMLLILSHTPSGNWLVECRGISPGSVPQCWLTTEIHLWTSNCGTVTLTKICYAKDRINFRKNTHNIRYLRPSALCVCVLQEVSCWSFPQVVPPVVQHVTLWPVPYMCWHSKKYPQTPSKGVGTLS